MRALCKLDYGQFEYSKRYEYTYLNNTQKYLVIGEYDKTQFNKKQFDAIFKPEKLNNYVRK